MAHPTPDDLDEATNDATLAAGSPLELVLGRKLTDTETYRLNDLVTAFLIELLPE